MTYQKYKLTSKEGTLEFTGRLIGSGNSVSVFHTNHDGYAYASQVPGVSKVKCRACRWNDVALYRTDDGAYIVHTRGRTVCPGEVDFGRLARTTSALEVVELLTVRANPPFITLPGARALAQAAEDDDDLHDAYVNRAVV